ncbi:hypothetical protein Tco_1038892 [Tanacetum coccineum]
MDLKNKLETITKNHQASIQNLEAKFDIFADKQFGQPSGSLPSNTQPNPKGSSSKPNQPLQARNEHVNAVFTRSGKSYDPPVNPNDQQNDSKTLINFDSDDEDNEPTPQPKPKTPKPINMAYSYQLNTAYQSSDTMVIKGEFEKPESLKISDDSFACNSSLEIFHEEFNRMSRMNVDLFTYEIEVSGLANLPCDLNDDDNLEQ